jgi:RNase P subunit RPR2
MSLYCEMGDVAEVYRTNVRTARKAHRCDECHRSITPGERYEEAVGFQDGSWWRMCTCHECLPIAAWVVRNCGCRIHGDLWRHLEEDVFCEMRGELPPGVHFKVGRWLVEARRGKSAQGGETEA